ncbi:Hypothetical protein ETEE_0391 [Edwardsiella anguillarum ET080813]|uniref:Uncharacterized protein n=1 Tax=Edwardsiella anguillarum ET080813 TaxID=667120 RepID=A0A076LMD6_9GAMM|nr:Hypothetical protein ETEE_0391 [Edwardsiella anguillarum ET080813]
MVDLHQVDWLFLRDKDIYVKQSDSALTICSKSPQLIHIIML